MIAVMDFLVKAYTVVLLFRFILTQQELSFNFVGRGVAKLTDPLFRLGKVPKSQTNKFIPLVILVLFFFYGVILALSERIGMFIGVIKAYQSMIGFLAIFFVVCVLLGSMAAPSTGAFPLFFYRLGNIFVKPVQKVTRIRNNAVIIPATVFIFVLYTIGVTVCLSVFFLITGRSIHIAAIVLKSCLDFFGMFITLLRYMIYIIIIRALLSWFSPDPRNIFVQLIYYITEPLLSRLRRVIPPIGMVDVSALVAIIMLGICVGVLSNLHTSLEARLLNIFMI